jgi:hypothetical protein
MTDSVAALAVMMLSAVLKVGFRPQSLWSAASSRRLVSRTNSGLVSVCCLDQLSHGWPP